MWHLKAALHLHPHLHRPEASDTRGLHGGASDAPRGQILVIFAGMLVVLLLMSALVVDLGWLWSNSLRIQRAADAAALAGVVHLPANQGNSAYITARAEAKKNGYTDGAGGVTVTPLKDADNPRRLDVTVEAPVETFFLRLIGMATVNITRTAQADYVLPVPMGSPLNYYGVGDFTTVVPGAPGNTGQRAPTSTQNPSDWSSASGAYSSGGSAANDDDGDTQGYDDFNFNIPNGATITGIEVRVKARSNDSSGCRIGVSIGNGDGDWSSWDSQDLTGSYVTSTLGSSTDRWGLSWSEDDSDDFAVRVRDEDPGSGCTNSARTDLDYLTVTVYYTGAASIQTSQVLDQNNHPLCASGSCSQGFWGAIEGQGSNRSTGDAYATGYNGSPTKNGEYDPNGYDYTLEIPSGGSVYVFDPTFCATTSSSTGGHYGAGDHWLGDAETVSTYFVLWNTNGTQTRGDDTLVKTSGSLFENENQADLLTGSTGFSDGGEPSNPTDCSVGKITNPGVGGYYHNKWWQMANVGAGTYRLQVTTTKPGSPNANWDESFENMWSLLVQGAGEPHIYGSGRMVSYANIPSGQQEFYLAQIDRQSGAGKTMEIRLFDPGDVGQKAWMQIFSPDGNTYTKATFDYAADNGKHGENVTCIQTYGGSGPSAPAGCPNDTSGGTYYQNSWITISVPLPASYGETGLTPPGETEAGWWKIRYTVNSGNDTTTWEVSLRGNPVHLVVP